MNARLFKVASLAVIAPMFISGCTSSMAALHSVQHHPAEASVLHSSPVRNSVTPMDEALACYGGRLNASGSKRLGIAVGDVKDYTGKQGQDEGFAITQGGALMAYSALGKLRAGIRLHERFDTRIADAELVYMNQRQLGDGRHHSIDDPNTGGQTNVPWKPYFGGSILQSDYFIVGGITELNYNIRSGGAEFAINNLGPRARTYTMNIAVDLRIVGTQTLMVYDTVSIEKQLTGYEVGLGVFRFFGNSLFDVNVGSKNQEPLQLGVRTAIEAGILQLVASVAGVNPSACIPAELGPVQWDGANAQAARAEAARLGAERREQEAVYKAELAGGEAPVLAYAQNETVGLEEAGAGAATDAGEAPSVLDRIAQSHDGEHAFSIRLADAHTRGQAATGGEFGIIFAEGSDELDRTSAATIARAASLVSGGRSVNLTISGRGEDSLSAEKTSLLHAARLQAIVIALKQGGVSQEQAQLLWQAGSTGSLFGSTSAGLREVARIRIG